MTGIWRILGMAAALALSAGSALAETPAERALRNYELIRNGAKKLGDLSEAERRELAFLEQWARASEKADQRTPRQRCIDAEVKREGGKPSELAMGAIDLKCSQL